MGLLRTSDLIYIWIQMAQPSGPDSFLKAIRGNSDLNSVRPTGEASVIKGPRPMSSIKHTIRGTFETSGGLSLVVWGTHATLSSIEGGQHLCQATAQRSRCSHTFS